jgi:hypothetical protein
MWESRQRIVREPRSGINCWNDPCRIPDLVRWDEHLFRTNPVSCKNKWRSLDGHHSIARMRACQSQGRCARMNPARGHAESRPDAFPAHRRNKSWDSLGRSAAAWPRRRLAVCRLGWQYAADRDCRAPSLAIRLLVPSNQMGRRIGPRLSPFRDPSAGRV